MPPPFFDLSSFATEIVFTIISVAFCFAIYFKTKETFELTKHKGIKYFREAFLFFGLSYIMRFLFSLALLSRIAFDYPIHHSWFVPILLFLLGYLSTAGIFYLLYSSLWRRFDNKNVVIGGHIVALVLSVVSFVTRSHFILLGLQTLLLVLAVVLTFAYPTSGKKGHQTKALYLLVGLLWLLNLWVIDSARPGPSHLEVVAQVVSFVVFILIYRRISKWVR